MDQNEIAEKLADFLRDQYMRDVGYLYVAEHYGIDKEIVQQAYIELDKKHKNLYKV